MKIQRSILSILATSSIFLAACGLEQNPLAGKPVGVSPEEGRTKPTPDPMKSDSLRLDSSAARFIFQETVASTFTISGRSLEEFEQAELVIENMQDFPGAQFDLQTGELKWAPPRGYTNSQLYRTESLRVRYSVFSKALQVRIGRLFEIPVEVQIKASQPVIVSVDDLTRNFVREDSTRNFVVTVRDEDSATNKGPRLMVLPSSNRFTRNAAGFVKQIAPNPAQDSRDPKLWTFQMQVDLNGIELTKSEVQAQFELIALSNFGSQSAATAVNVNIRTDLEDPLFNFQVGDEIELKAGVRTELNFEAMDPALEGLVTMSLPFFNASLGYIDDKCVSSGARSYCRVLFQPAATEAGKSFVHTFSAVSSHPVTGDTLRRNANRSLRFKVIPADVVPVDPPPEQVRALTGGQ